MDSQPESASSDLPPDWLGKEILLPFVLTRFMLLWTGYFAQYFPVWDLYPQTANAQGWLFSPWRWLDIWGRWDTYWYLDIIQHGYQLRGDITQVQSNIAFFPLYPFLVKFFSGLIPLVGQTPTVIFGVGVLLSNLLAIAALILLYRLTVQMTDNRAIAAKTVQYLLFFPTGFYLSCFYTESLFLCLMLLAFRFALQGRWAIAAIAGFGLAMTRPQGVLILIPLGWQYLEQRNWRIAQLRANSLWLGLVPVGFLLFLLGLYPLTHSLTAPLDIQVAWGKVQSYPWETLLQPRDYNPFTTPIDQWVLLGSLLVALLAIPTLKSMSYGVYAVLMLLPPLFTGILRSTSRYSLVVFPLFIMLGILTQRYPTLDRWLPSLLLTLQILMMAAWCQLYWVA